MNGLDHYPRLERMMDDVLTDLEAEYRDEREALVAFAEVKRKLGLHSGRYWFKKAVRISLHVAAALFLPLLAGMILYVSFQEKNAGLAWNEIQVPVGQVREVRLADGSALTLNSGSRITYPQRFSRKSREIFMEGEVYADIAHDPKKPFVIHAGPTALHVLGTKFDFKSFSNSEVVEVLLLEGNVRFDVHRDSVVSQTSLNAGNYLQYNKTLDSYEIKPINPENYRSFADGGAIHFFNIPLQDIVKDLERIFGQRIVILDRSLAQKKIFAMFSNGESLEEILQALNSDNSMKLSADGEAIYIETR